MQVLSAWAKQTGPDLWTRCTGLRRYIAIATMSFYDLSAKNLAGEEVSFSKYRGKVVLIENVASL